MNIELLLKYSKPGPRYTSYPPATYFKEDIKIPEFKNSIIQSNQLEPRNISVYIHFPFCRQLCYFCGCNTSLVPDDKTVEVYLNTLIKEILSVSDLLDRQRPLTQIHWGGGSPNIAINQIEKVMDVLMTIFTPAKNIEIAMECHPAWLELHHIKQLAAMGFNRLSLGVQDFNNDVLAKVNRKPSKYSVEELIACIKGNHIKGVNIDLIYGLPAQSADTFSKTIETAINASPDRLTTFSYAHVPWIKPEQKNIEELGFPDTASKLAMCHKAHSMLTQNGYVAIGMDHFAKPDDELSRALRTKTLHRNFQGYCTRDITGQLYGFGATAISQLSNGYFQNCKSYRNYIDSIDQNGFATERGYLLSQHDTIVQTVINQIMCNGYINLFQTAKDTGISVAELKSITGYSIEKLKPFVEDGLMSIDGNTIRLLENGFRVVRNIAMAFDPKSETANTHFSKTI